MATTEVCLHGGDLGAPGSLGFGAAAGHEVSCRFAIGLPRVPTQVRGAACRPGVVSCFTWPLVCYNVLSSGNGACRSPSRLAPAWPSAPRTRSRDRTDIGLHPFMNSPGFEARDRPRKVES